ncbi:alpha/beta-Hydrolases superfamily protein [Euphorbia peplus]|nr:alpha/beta-Hydrolases superfamily protein [Euphorbia peplus]
MAGGGMKRNISYNQNTSFKLPSGIFTKVLLIFIVGISAWGYQAIQPPPTKICGSPGGPSVTGPRIKLRDGRHLAYKEHGVSKDVAKYKIIFLHGFGSCKHEPVLDNGLSPEFAKQLGVYIVNFDRPGYGESDPHPSRTLKSLTLDIEELADQLLLGSKFYLIGYSMGGMLGWSCLKYIPHRLAGVSLLTPATNYWWPVNQNLGRMQDSKEKRNPFVVTPRLDLATGNLILWI